jgi:hypothetical protein
VLCADTYQPGPELFPSVELVYVPFRDRIDVTPAELDLALRGARKVALRLALGRRCLVTCEAGRNRSGLVSALALAMHRGIDPAKAGELVRRARGPNALINPAFVSFLNSGHPECELCQARPETRIYYQDALCWVADCKSCGTPMVVLRRHSTTPTPDEVAVMVKLLVEAAPPDQELKIDFQRRSVPGHWHAHLR